MGVQIRQGEGAFWRVVRFIEVRRESPCQKINNGITAPLLQQTAMLSTGWCHITFSPLKNPPTWDAAFHQNPSTTFYPHRPTGKVWIYRLLFVCFLFARLRICSAEDKASGVKCYSAVYRRPRQGITHFCELCSHRSPKSDESASARATPTHM